MDIEYISVNIDENYKMKNKSIIKQGTEDSFVYSKVNLLSPVNISTFSEGRIKSLPFAYA